MDTRTHTAPKHATARPAEIVREYGPFDGTEAVHGVTYDGHRVWAAIGPRILAFDGTHLYQIREARIDKIDPATGAVLHTIPAPGKGGDSGMAWADGSLWVGAYRERRIHQVDPESGEVLRSLDADRFVTGVSWVDGELWHGTWEEDESELRRIDPDDGTVLERLRLPAGIGVSGLESDGADLFYCGGGPANVVRAVRRPRAAA